MSEGWGDINKSTNPFSPDSPGAILFDKIIVGSPSLSLTSGSRRPVFQAMTELQTLSAEKLFGDRVQEHAMAQTVKIGLYLLGGADDEAHTLAQQYEMPEANYWHGIVHRREPDYGNAKYWFRKVGYHPVFDDLARYVQCEVKAGNATFSNLIPAGKWDPFCFIDSCQICVTEGRKELRDDLETIQLQEIVLLLTHCVQHLS